MKENTLRYLLPLIFVLSLMGCASSKKDLTTDEAKTSTDKIIIEEFNRGVGFLDQEAYKKAAIVFHGLLKKYPTSDLELLTQYNLAAAYEGMGRCDKARKIYRIITRSAQDRYHRIQAMAFFRLSHVYECLGNDKMVVASLLDAHQRRQYLTEETAAAELPARLAAAYARIGQKKSAEKYLNATAKGIQALQQKYKNPTKKRELMAKTLYFMGRTNRPAKIPAAAVDSFLGTLRYLQGFLLRSVELDHPKWSTKAVQELLDSYDFLWAYTNLEPAKLKIEDDMQMQERREAELVEEALISLKQLKAQRFPDKNEPTLVKKLFASLSERERKYLAFLDQHSVKTPLTPEAQKREGLAPPVRMRDNPSVLERRATERKKVSPKKSSPKKDPNL